MNPASLLPILLMFAAGSFIAMQAPTNALLARAGGSPVIAALISFAVGTIALFIVWVLSGSRPGTSAFMSLRWYAWCGGLYGAIYVAISAYSAPRLGLASLITIGVAGQVVMALWLDQVGAFGLPREPLNLGRVAGALLVIVGVVLVRRS